MTKKHFIALADAIKLHDSCEFKAPFTSDQIETLCGFCHRMNRDFDAYRFCRYIAGKCGPSGGKIKTKREAGQ